jgi:hypothetical protein
MPLTKVTRGALTADIIDSTKLADNAVDTEHLAADAVESAEIGENITFTGDYIGLPVFANNTARDAGITSPAAGMMCFNTAQSAVQQYTGATSGWSDIAPAPTFSSFGSGAAVNEDTNTTVTINGSQFTSGMTVKLVDNSDDSDITGHTALSYTLVSSAQITVTVPAATTALTSGDVVYFIITKGGIAVSSSTLTVEADPVWVTNAGTLTTSPTTTWDNVSSGNIVTLSATSSTGAVTYTTSNLDSEFSLSSAGVISVASAITDVSGGYPATRTESFDVNAITDGIAEAATSRAFNIIVTGYIAATGGTRTTYGSYVVHSFTSTGNTTFTVNETLSCDILVVAGGGGGGGRVNSGGGGAGGMLTFTNQSLVSGDYTVVVGAGGDGGSVGDPWSSGLGFGADDGDSGGNSRFGALTNVIGGGGGGSWEEYYSGGTPGPGGSGGGGSGYYSNYGAGTSGQGNNGGGGSGGATKYNSGGGGGAGAVGVTAGNNPGAGGAGLQNDFRTGSNVYYAGGGGGASYQYTGGGNTGGSGGSGGGGKGADFGDVPVDGTDGLGGGGGGSSGYGTLTAARAEGGDGGNGIVVVRYAV